MPTAAPIAPATNPTTALPLRDIHLPQPVSSWWPPAPGWWLLLALLVIVAGLVWLLLRWRKQRRWRVAALAELASIEAFYKSNNNRTQLLRELSALLRRVAVMRFPRTDCAALNGTAWLRFLDASAGCSGFLDGPGQLLASAPYQRPAADSADATALLELCRSWLKKLPRKAVS